LSPYRNGTALTASYCGVFSIIPCAGLILGPVALTLGIMGLQVAKREPERKGTVHAWIGIIAGGLFGLMNLAGVALWIFALLAARHAR
jgi:uncharacterized protein YqgC (DUF456 family)